MVTPTKVQLQIRDLDDLSLLVIAPAGCGKTEALALRVAGLIDRGVARGPRKILVTTFSNRARDNVRDRLRSYVSEPVLRDRVYVTNFHGFSARIYRAHAQTIGQDPGSALPASDWVREQCHDRRLQWDQIVHVEKVLRYLKQQPALTDDEIVALLEAHDERLALGIERQRVSENRLTYDDLPRMAELILKNEAVADLYRHHFCAVVVDEFQDLTPQQLRIVNRIGKGRTTYAGDVAQGIYGFAGAQPAQTYQEICAECTSVVRFTESHRSSPAVLSMVNSLTALTGGMSLTSANPDSWPGGGLAAVQGFDNPEKEGAWAVDFAAEVLGHARQQRVGIICRNAQRRKTVDGIAERSGLPVYRWDDGVLDTDTARILKNVLRNLDIEPLLNSDHVMERFRDMVNYDSIADVETKRSVLDALVWCLERFNEGMTPEQVRERIRVGDDNTLVTAPGVHLLSGHAGKGQQFDWVVVVGVEDGIVPDWRSRDKDALLEDARILSVMLSRARHGIVLTYATAVPDRKGLIRHKAKSRYLKQLESASVVDARGVAQFLRCVDWDAIERR